MAQNRSQSSSSRRGGASGGGPPGRAAALTGDPNARAADFRGAMSKLIEYLGEHRPAIIATVVLAMASTIFAILGPRILGTVTTEVFEGVVEQLSGTGDGIDFDVIRNTMLLLLGLYVISSAFSFAQNYIIGGVTMRVTYQMRREISQKLHRLPLQYYDRTSQGEVLSRITNDVDTISQTLNQSLGQIVTSTTTVIGILIMMLSISFWMTLATMIVVPVSIAVMTLIIRNSQVFFKKQQQYLGRVNGHIEEMYTGHLVVQAFNGEAKSLAAFEEYNDTLYETAWKSSFISGLVRPILNIVGNIGYVIVSILGGYFAIRGVITVGEIQAFIQYSREFNQPIFSLASISNILQQTAAASERVFEFLNEDEEVPNTTSPVQDDDIEGAVAFREVAFGYNPEQRIIKGFSTTVQPGQKIAIVGPTGAGKTTVVKLLMRFYDVDEGAILVDGHDIRDFTRHDLRQIFGMVLQDTWLYNDTIRENIRYGRLDATDEEVIAAAKAAYVDPFVRVLPNGYDTVLAEDASNLSQGQEQLLTIARVILADPRVLILDEATSSVDTRTEVLIQAAMDGLMQGRTSFVIAHRLSTIRNADSILVMRDGDIVEQGDHDTLLAQNGLYADLYNSQFSEEAELSDASSVA